MIFQVPSPQVRVFFVHILWYATLPSISQSELVPVGWGQLAPRWSADPCTHSPDSIIQIYDYRKKPMYVSQEIVGTDGGLNISDDFVSFIEDRLD